MSQMTRTGGRARTRDEEPPNGRDATRVDAATRRRDRWLLLSIFLVLGLVFGGAYAGAYVVAGDHLPRNTTVAGVDVGGMRPAQARATVKRELRERLRQPVRVAVGGSRFRLDPERVGLDVDVAASVAQAPVGRSWDPADMWESFVGGGDYPPVVVQVDNLLRQRLRAVARRASFPARNGRVVFTRRGPEAIYPRTGERLHVGRAVRAVRAAYPSDGSVLTLPTVRTRPEIRSRDVTRAMRRFANPAMASPVTYRIGLRQVVLRPADFASALSMRPQRGRLVPKVDGDALMAAFHDAARAGGRSDLSVPRRRVVGTFLDLVVADGRDRRLVLPAG